MRGAEAGGRGPKGEPPGSHLVQGVAQDLDVHLVQVLAGEGVGEVGRQGSVHQHQPVQLPHVAGHRQRGDAVEHAQRVALRQQVLRAAAAQCRARRAHSSARASCPHFLESARGRPVPRIVQVQEQFRHDVKGRWPGYMTRHVILQLECYAAFMAPGG